MGNGKEKQGNHHAELTYFEKMENTCERDTFIFSKLLLSNFSLGCCVYF